MIGSETTMFAISSENLIEKSSAMVNVLCNVCVFTIELFMFFQMAKSGVLLLGYNTE